MHALINCCRRGQIAWSYDEEEVEGPCALRPLDQVPPTERSLPARVWGVVRFGLSLIYDTYHSLCYPLSPTKLGRREGHATRHLIAKDVVVIHSPQLQLPLMRKPRNDNLFAASPIAIFTQRVFGPNIFSSTGETHKRLAHAGRRIIAHLCDQQSQLASIIDTELALWTWKKTVNLAHEVPLLLLRCLICGLTSKTTSVDFVALLKAISSSTSTTAIRAATAEIQSVAHLICSHPQMQPLLSSLSQFEQTALITMILVAGVETTSTTIINALRTSSTNFQEALRFRLPVSSITRTTAQPCALVSKQTGRPIKIFPANTHIVLSLENPQTHLFSTGASACLGKPLAELLFSLFFTPFKDDTYAYSIDTSHPPQLKGGITNTYTIEHGPFATISGSNKHTM